MTQAKTKTNTALAKRDWLVDEMCFRYIRKTRLYAKKGVSVTAGMLSCDEPVARFKERVIRDMEHVKFRSKLDRVFGIGR